jgi:hypothetical protein
LNDSVLSYDAGVPQLSGDELRLVSRATRSQTFMYEVVTLDGHTQIESFTSTTDYTMSFRALGPSGNHFSNDALQTNFDLASFSSLFFEFQQVVPVQGDGPRPICFQHWLGVVDSVVAIPEPSSLATFASALVGGIICRSRTKRRLDRAA